VLVLERRPRVGGAAVPKRSSRASSSDVLLRRVVAAARNLRDLDLPRHGLHILPLESTVTPMENGRLSRGLGRSRRNPARAVPHSLRDAEAYDEYGA